MHSTIHAVRKVHTFLRSYNIFNYAAQLSYGLMLALLPLVMLLNWALRYLFTDASAAKQISEFITTYMSPQLASLIAPSLNATPVDVTSSLGAFIGNIALLVFVILAVLRFMRSCIQVMTRMCGMKEHRNVVQIWLLAIGNLIIIIAVLALAVFIYLESRFFVVDLLKQFPGDVEFHDWIEWCWDKLITLAFAVIAVIPLNWILAKSPADSIKFSQAWPGTIVVIVGWLVLFAFMRFVNGYLQYEGVLQIVDSGISIILDIYLISFVLLLGVITNYTLAQRRLHRVVAAQPIGEAI